MRGSHQPTKKVRPVRLYLRQYCENLGITQADIHFGTHLAFGTIRGYWKGTQQQVDLKVLASLCDFLQCEVEDILARRSPIKITTVTLRQGEHRETQAVFTSEDPDGTPISPPRVYTLTPASYNRVMWTVFLNESVKMPGAERPVG